MEQEKIEELLKKNRKLLEELNEELKPSKLEIFMEQVKPECRKEIADILFPNQEKPKAFSWNIDSYSSILGRYWGMMYTHLFYKEPYIQISSERFEKPLEDGKLTYSYPALGMDTLDRKKGIPMLEAPIHGIVEEVMAHELAHSLHWLALISGFSDKKLKYLHSTLGDILDDNQKKDYTKISVQEYDNKIIKYETKIRRKKDYICRKQHKKWNKSNFCIEAIADISAITYCLRHKNIMGSYRLGKLLGIIGLINKKPIEIESFDLPFSIPSLMGDEEKKDVEHVLAIYRQDVKYSREMSWDYMYGKAKCYPRGLMRTMEICRIYPEITLKKLCINPFENDETADSYIKRITQKA
ncbi:MAG: hypothetical protein PHO02_01770 [Candidatus Nanoarchaeia archaeon]|nr:hypothetical protein [Candidatus Nanoarchaeia archaeon]